MVELALGLEERVLRVFGEVAAAAERVGRDPSSVTVVAVSKTVEREAVDAAYHAGIRHFGENRVQDAAAKFATALPDDATLHMIGHLQSNKANVAARLFQMIESVDRRSIVLELEKQATKLGRCVPVLLQVNIAGEEQKAGCDPTEADELVELVRRSTHLDLRGLMTIAPLVEDAELVRPVFRGLRELRDRLQERQPDVSIPILSMGMSNDFRVAIEEGATQVRVGRAIFSG
jgi:pyridoxal phosphate enzyme (YggS family)